MMEGNIFLEGQKELTLQDYMNYNTGSRTNLGKELPVAVYRLLEYSLREQIMEDYGKEEQIRIFRKAGYRAGKYFAEHMLDLTLPPNEFVSMMLEKFESLKIGVVRIEKLDLKQNEAILTVSEDADCSGLPVLGETVCNYDEGFISGVLSVYTGKDLYAVEVDCWATGDRVCRFCVDGRPWQGE